MHSILKFLRSSTCSTKFLKFNHSLQRTISSKDVGDSQKGNPVKEELPDEKPPKVYDRIEDDTSNDLDDGELRSFYPEPTHKIGVYHRSMLEIFKDEFKQYGKYLKDPKNNSFRRRVIPGDVEVLIIGAGPIGASIAYWLQTLGGHRMDIIVIDRKLDADEFMNDSMINVIPQLAVGHLTQQFGLKENILLAKFAAEFVRDITKHLMILDDVQPISFKPFGHLNIASKKSVDTLKERHIELGNFGVHTEMMTAFQLGQRFPWLNTNDIAFGCHGLLDEGWFDPLDYLLNIKTAAMRKGVLFVEAEPLEFLYDETTSDMAYMKGFRLGEYQPCTEVVLKESNGNIRKLTFAHCFLAVGGNTGDFTKNLLHITKENGGMFQFEVPIEKRKRYVYCFEAPDGGPSVSSPLVNDPSGLFFRREGLSNTYICGCPPPPSEEPRTDNLEPDTDYFYNRVWPLLANRVPVFEQLNLKSVYTYFEDYNAFDGNPIIGMHPAYHNFYIAAGFGNKAYQYAPGIGRAFAEHFMIGYYQTIDLTRFNFNRVVQEQPLIEKYIL